MPSLSGKKRNIRKRVHGLRRSALRRFALLALCAAGAPAQAQPSSSHCAEWTRRLPNLSAAQCDSAGLRPSGAQSVKGFPVYQRDVTPRTLPPAAASAQRRKRVLVIGGIHGDELSSASIVFHWISYAASAPEAMDWRFIPALNPDGLMASPPTRYNARGVDLNRNFPTPGWGRQALTYWAERTGSDKRRYPGPQAASEPETRFIVQTMARWKPDLVVSLHAPYALLDFDGPSPPPHRLGRLHLNRVGTFPGSLGHYGGVHKGVPVVTIELPSAIRTPTDGEMRQMWVDLTRWIRERETAS